jgi:acetyltransferase-like isoleucine patch superfamily enzyme
MARKVLKIFRSLPKTLYFNFKYLPFSDAVKLPFFISSKVYCKKMQGKVILTSTKICRGMVRIGFGGTNSGDEIKTRSVWNNNGIIEFKGSAHLGFGTRLFIGEKGHLTFGNDFCITADSEIDCYNRISFGDGCLVSWNCIFMDSDSHRIYDGDGEILNPDGQIEIGNNCWIGCRALCLKGVTIPENCVIAAQSVLTKQLEEPNCIYGGNPAKKIGNFNSWKR